MSILFQHFASIIPLLLVVNLGHSARNKVTNRIIGGKLGDQRFYPFIVRLHATWQDNTSVRCGGSIVNNYVIVTACQCIWKMVGKVFMYPKKTKIRAGVGNLGKHSYHEESRAGSYYFVHPDCKYSENEAFWLNDVGLVEMNQQIFFTRQIKPLRVFNHDEKVAMAELKRLAKKGVECTSPGWGMATSRKRLIPTASQLRDIQMELIPLETCEKTLCKRNGSFCFDYNKHSGSILCADSLSGSPCYGDTGGPLICNGYVFGMVSTVTQCARALPLIYTNISPMLDLVNWRFNDLGHSTGYKVKKSMKRRGRKHGKQKRRNVKHEPSRKKKQQRGRRKTLKYGKSWGKY